MWRQLCAEAAKLAAQLCLTPAERNRLPPRGATPAALDGEWAI